MAYRVIKPPPPHVPHRAPSSKFLLARHHRPPSPMSKSITTATPPQQATTHPSRTYQPNQPANYAPLSPTLERKQPPTTTQDVNVLRSKTPNLFGAKDCTGRSGNRHGFRHVQPVCSSLSPNPPLSLFKKQAFTNFHCSSLVKSCTSKCIDTSYREADLNKGESVCLDRCVSKFFEVNVKVSEKMQGEAQGKQGGGGGGMFGGGM